MIVASYTLGDALITVLELGFLFLWIWIAVGVVFDIFRSRDLSNWSKALWMLFIFALPLVGVLAYLVVRGHTMHEHQLAAQARADAFQRYVDSGPSAHVDDLVKLADLKDRGLLTDEEFEHAKAKALAR